MRRQFTPEQKTRVALAALAGDKTINQVATQFEVHPSQVKQWRGQPLYSFACFAVVPALMSESVC